MDLSQRLSQEAMALTPAWSFKTGLKWLLLSAMLLGSTSHADRPPRIPEHWSSTGVQFISSPHAPPPFAATGGVPPAPYTSGRMVSFYDWSKRAMVEHYMDRNCVPIWPQARPTDPGFECTFLNVNETSFLVTYAATRPPWALPCCVFGRPFHPPAPDFLANLTNVTELPSPSPVNGSAARWWEVGIAPPTGPFYYAWTLPLSATEQNYAAFDFPGIGSWVTQNVASLSPRRPPPAAFELPAEQCGTDPAAVPPCPSSFDAVRPPPHYRLGYSDGATRVR